MDAKSSIGHRNYIVVWISAAILLFGGAAIIFYAYRKRLLAATSALNASAKNVLPDTLMAMLGSNGPSQNNSNQPAQVNTSGPQQTAPMNPTGPQQQAISYPNAITIFKGLQDNFGVVGNTHDPLNATNRAQYGITQIRNRSNSLDASGALIPSMALPFMKVSSVYYHLGCHNTGNIFSGSTDCTQKGFCAFPTEVYKTSDGYYIAVLYDVVNHYPYGSIAAGLPWGAALYDPNMNYVGKATRQADIHGGIAEIHPFGSPEYKTKDMGCQCY